MIGLCLCFFFNRVGCVGEYWVFCINWRVIVLEISFVGEIVLCDRDVSYVGNVFKVFYVNFEFCGYLNVEILWK